MFVSYASGGESFAAGGVWASRARGARSPVYGLGRVPNGSFELKRLAHETVRPPEMVHHTTTCI